MFDEAAGSAGSGVHGDIGQTDGSPSTAPSLKSSDNSVEQTELFASPRSVGVSAPAYNFRLEGDRRLAPNWRDRAAHNLEAMRLALKIEQEKRPATEAEQRKLIRFVGFGASELANSLFPHNGEDYRKGYEKLGRDLEKLVSADELAAIRRATQYAHYTPEFMVKAIWKGLRRIGFTGGQILEPGCGTGLFIALMPEGIASRSKVLGVEREPVTARIARLLYPESQIVQADFKKAVLPPSFDLAIGNPPFQDVSVKSDDEAGRLELSLHDYFIARSIERLRPGGLAAFVVSRYTMDKARQTAREYIASKADLLGAIRLSQGAMREKAGTDVVVDLLFFRKRIGDDTPTSQSWIEADFEAVTGDVSGGFINRYFSENPSMVLGDHAITTSQFGPIYTCKAGKTPLDILLADAIRSLPVGIYRPALEGDAKPESIFIPTVTVGTAADGARIKEGSYFVERGKLVQIVNGGGQTVKIRSKKSKDPFHGGQFKSKNSNEGIFPKHAAIIRGLIEIRDATRDVLAAQVAEQPWKEHQERLRQAYQAFAKEFGPINRTTRSVKDEGTPNERVTVRRPNLTPFLDDPDVWLVSSIEDYDPEADVGVPGPIFTKRVIQPPKAVSIATGTDALAVVLNERGFVDIDRIAELRSKTVDEAVAELGDAIYFDPATSSWQTADEYLSGAVRTKLARARLEAEKDEKLARNVAALEKVQPKDLKPSEITARLGAPWMPVRDVEQFVKDAMGIETSIIHETKIATWNVAKGPFWGKAAATSEWGTERRAAGELLEDALNSHLPQIYDHWTDEDGKDHRVLNPKETEAAKEKLTKIKQAFEGWVWSDTDRGDRLARLYNDTYNNLVTRNFDGAHLTLPGASDAIKMRPHQLRAIWRIISDGSTYLAHAVGAGKTFASVAAVMEQKRLGLISKPMIIVPGHTLAQWAREFMLLYPSCRILVADENNFAMERRAQFLARAATGLWDAIIITHPAFKFIATPTDFERAMINDVLSNFEAMLDSVSKEDRVSRKRLERLKEALEAKLEALKSRKDNMLTIAELGVDQLIVDEAQEFRKLTFSTNQTTLKGIDPDGSQRAWDLYVKIKYVGTKRPGRAIIMASGTPITNTMGEMFSLTRFMAEYLLADRHVHEFDAWAATFGDTRTMLELQPSGNYKPVTRFCEFINVPELVDMFRTKADVALKDHMRPYMKLPRIKGGKRQIITAEAAPAFKAYQKILAGRIKCIEKRTGKPVKGQDIILSVINDGRHAAIDTRLVNPRFDLGRLDPMHVDPLDYDSYDLDLCGRNDPNNKLNKLIENVFRIWQETADNEYVQPATGVPYALRGAAQMIFCDLGLPDAEEKRGFSPYLWIRQRLVEMGVPFSQIAFMQDYNRSDKKQRLFNAVNSGKVRILLGSRKRMGTGVNAQLRLKALHHLDVPWLPSDIEQSEGRIERQGNQNEEIEIYAYATLGSLDAQMWQTLERKQRFINAALSGDKSVRKLEDLDTDAADQFAMAKAIASGDQRLMQKAGLESEVARLIRLRNAHVDDQFAVRRHIQFSRSELEAAERRIPLIEADLAKRISTRGDAFSIEVRGEKYTDRVKAGQILATRVFTKWEAKKPGDEVVAKIGGFDLVATGTMTASGSYYFELALDRRGSSGEIKVRRDTSPVGLLQMVERQIGGMEEELVDCQIRVRDCTRSLAEYEPRVGQPFPYQAELEAKQAELSAIEVDLASDGKEEAPANDDTEAGAAA